MGSEVGSEVGEMGLWGVWWEATQTCSWTAVTSRAFTSLCALANFSTASTASPA